MTYLNKNYFFHFLLVAPLFVGAQASAQQVDFDQVVQPVDARARDFSEYLVQLAWMNSPESAIAHDALRNAESQAENTRKEWLRDVQGTFNLNEANVRKTSGTDNAFFPRYNFGLTINPFNILTQKEKNKMGKRTINMAEHEVNREKLRIRAETLARYAQFKLARAIVKTRTLTEQEMYANYLLIQQLYKTDEKNFEEYTLAAKTYYSAQEERLKAEADLQVARFRLEEMIGIRWEQVQHEAKEE